MHELEPETPNPPLVSRGASTLWAGLGLAAMLLTGCASRPRTALTLDPVGPLTGAAVGAFSRPTGYLEVHTETEPYNDGGFVYYRQTPYSVYDSEGRRAKSVVNRVGMTDQRPMTVPLPAGRYRVYARAEGYGLVEVPVVIVGTRLTEVHLQRSGLKDASGIPESERVVLPDGRIVGRRGEAAMPSKQGQGAEDRTSP